MVFVTGVRHRSCTPRFWTLFLTNVSLFAIVGYLSHTSSHDPTSLFFSPTHAFDSRYSLIRRAQAFTFLEDIASSTRISTPEPQLCVGITTVQREEDYFRTAVASLLEGLTAEERDEIYLVVLVANANPALHQDFNQTWFRNLPDRIITYETTSEKEATLVRELESQDLDHRAKPLHDYVKLLRSCHSTGAPFVLMLEDDVLAASGWYPQTQIAIRELQEKRNFHKAIYLRLFYTTHLLGWNKEEWRSYLCKSLFATGCIGLLLVWLRLVNTPAARILNNLTLGLLVAVYTPLCIGVFFAAGRLTVAPLRSGLRQMDRFGCCSQALVFPQDRIPALADFYERQGVGFVDTLAEEYADAERLERWALVPPVFQHIGAKSSKGDDFGEEANWKRSVAQNIWNFEFELLGQGGLRA